VVAPRRQGGSQRLLDEALLQRRTAGLLRKRIGLWARPAEVLEWRAAAGSDHRSLYMSQSPFEYRAVDEAGFEPTPSLL
jgi:hypothetical protein